MLAPNPSLLYLLTPLIATTISFILIVFILSQNRKGLSRWIFCALVASVGLWSLFVYAMRSSPDVQHALIWDRVASVAAISTFVFYYHFTVIYTNAKRQKWFVVIAYLLLGVTVVLNTRGLIIKDILVENYGYTPVQGPLTYLLSAMTLPLIAGGVYNLLRRYSTSIKYEEKNRLLVLVIAILFPIAGAAFDAFTKLPPLLIWGQIILCMVYSVALLRFHLFDIRVVIRKSAAYLLTSTIIAILITGLILIFNQLLGKGHFTVWLYIILLLLVTIGVQGIWLQLQNLVDRLFFRERYDFLRELEHFSQEAHDISDLNKLGSSLVDLIGRSLKTTGVRLFVSDEFGFFNLIASTGEYVPVVSFQSNNPLIRWMSRNKQVVYRHQIDIIPQLQSLTVKERAILADMDVELFVPLRNNKDELIGLLTLARKRSEQSYTAEDLRRISTVSNRVAIELENARLYARETSMRMEMQRQNEQKTEFLHHVAHELKTPLTAIISSSELVTSEELMVNPEQKERLLTNINRSAWLMDKRVGELLDLARIQIGTLELKLEPVDVSEMAHDLTSQLAALFKNKEQAIDVNIPDDLPKVRADKERVEEIMINLLSNANKFSPAQGKIVVRASALRNRVIVEVKDSASLISDEDKMRIFNAYYRGGTDEDRQRISGLGLGLAISKSLIELHHGEIGVKNEDKSGNIFYFTLPIWGVGDEKQNESTSSVSREGV